MKMFQANADIPDCLEHIEAVLSANAPVDLHENLAGIAAKSLLDSLSEHATPNALERVVAAYMKKKGADSVVISSKNKPGKTGCADCDVRADKSLNIPRRAGGDGFTYIPWVISTAKFDAQAELEAH